jgi:hypothetical protein
MVNYGRIDCLSHPLCENLLQRKWQRYGFLIYGTTTMFYFLFLTLLTTIVITYPSQLHNDHVSNETKRCEDIDDCDRIFVSLN